MSEVATYECANVSDFQNIHGGYSCKTWVLVEPQQTNPFYELNNLSPAETWEILGLTAAIFANAWMWKQLSLFLKRP